jgi:hypothetical protein
MQDPDIQVNYEIWLRFRDKLVQAPTLENFYLGLFQGDGVDVPPLFVDQLTQILCQHLMAHDIDKCLKFKPQNLLINLPLAETS